MKRRIKYTDEPLPDLEVVDDFLPPPEQLVLREDNVKITIALSKSSLRFFKRIAKRHRTPYQTMIRKILNVYAYKYGEESRARR